MRGPCAVGMLAVYVISIVPRVCIVVVPLAGPEVFVRCGASRLDLSYCEDRVDYDVV